jgi:hypothetical protein
MLGRNKYITAAADVQRGVKKDEANNLQGGGDDYSEAEMRQAIVHTRQDMVLLTSLLASLNGQIATIRRLLWLGTLGLVWFLMSRFL